jgi:hypothetical protein
MIPDPTGFRRWPGKYGARVEIEPQEGGAGDALLLSARKGDQDAFRALVEAHRAELHAHCYRMLASYHDAEDALQDAMVRAWRALPSFEGRSSLRAWLYKIATNAALETPGSRPQSPKSRRTQTAPRHHPRLGECSPGYLPPARSMNDPVT